METKYLTKKEAAEYLRLSVNTIDSLRNRGELACSKPGGKRVVFDRAVLDEYMRKSAEGGAE